MGTGIRFSLGVGVLAWVGCLAAPVLPDGRAVREQVVRAARDLPSLVKWIDLPDHAEVGLAFVPGPQKGVLEEVPGKWPEQRAAHVFYGGLVGDPVNPSDKGFTVSLWLRVRDLERVDRDGYKRTVGGVMAVGSGYYDGWRLAATPDSGAITFTVGVPEKGGRSATAYGLAQRGSWHHVACTWDRRRLLVYLDGTAQTEALVDCAYTPPDRLPKLRIGECGYGLGVLDFEIAEVALFHEALAPEVIERLGNPLGVLERQLAEGLAAAHALAEKAGGRAAPEEEVRAAFRPLAELPAEEDGATPIRNTRALARLALAESSRREGRFDEARRECDALRSDPDAPPHFQWLAMLAHADAWRDERRYEEARREYEQIRAAFVGKHEHYRVTALDRLADVAGLAEGEPFRSVRARRIERLSRPQPTFFLAPDGDDANPGTRERPFRTLERARDAVREARAKAPLAKGGIAVVLAGGVYPRTRSFALGEADSGTEEAPIVYRSAPGERAILRGGVAIDGFRPLAHAAGRARIPESAQAHVLEADLRAAGVDDLGTFRRRGYGVRGADVASHLELFFRNRPMPLAGWPNPSAKLAERFTTVKDVIGENMGDFVGKDIDRTNGFVYGDPRHANWVGEAEIWLYGYWTRMYAGTYQKVKEIDPAKGRLRIEEPLPPYGGFIKGGPYYAVNVLCELDSPGEWYVDKENGMLFFWPPSPVGRGEAVVSLLEAPLLALENVSHVAFRDLTLEAGRLHGATLAAGEDVVLAGCIVRGMGVSGVLVNGGRNHALVGCDLEYLGDGGVSLSGGDPATLLPSGHLVENCHLHHFDRWNRAGYQAGVIQDGVGSRISHCLIHDAPHQAVLVKGNDHILEYTEIHDTCHEAGEMGSYYMYGGDRVLGERGQLVRFNNWHHLSWDETYKDFAFTGRHALHIDHMNGDITLFGNLFWQCDTRSGAFFSGGPDNTVENNLFHRCSRAIDLNDRSWVYGKVNKEPNYPLDAYLRTRKVAEPPWSVRYPRLRTFPEKATDLAAFLVGNRIERNIIVACDQGIVGSRKTRELARIEDNWIKGDPGFRDPERGDFRLRADSPVYAAIGFEALPTDRIGLYRDELRATWPVEHPAGNHESVFAVAKTKIRLPSCRAAERSAPIVIDGTLTAEEWDGLDPADAIPIARSPADSPATAPPSHAWIRRDRDHLYLAIRNEVNPAVPLEALESWWGGDMLEVIVEGSRGVGTGGWWLDEKPHGPLFYLLGDHRGRFDSICIEGLPKLRAELLRNGVSYAAKVESPGLWTAEWRIPLALLCIDPEKTPFCHFNIGVCKPGTRTKDGGKPTGNALWVAWEGTAGPNWQVWNAGRLILRNE